MDTLIIIVKRGSQKRGFLLSKYKMMNHSILFHDIHGNVRVSMLYQCNRAHPCHYEHPSTWIYKVSNHRRAENCNIFKQRCFEYNDLSTNHAKRHWSHHLLKQTFFKNVTLKCTRIAFWGHFGQKCYFTLIIKKLIFQTFKGCILGIGPGLSVSTSQ